MKDDARNAPAASKAGGANRRRVLVFLGAGIVASLFSRDQARAGHDGTNILHLGEGNATPPDKKTGVGADVNSFAFDLDNFNTGDTAGGLHGRSLGNLPAIQGVGHDPSFAGVFGVSGDAAGSIGRGSRSGVMGISGSGPGVDGSSESGTGVSGHSNTGPGVEGRSDHGVGGYFSTLDGYALQTGGPAHVGASWNNFAFTADNQSADEAAGGIYAIGRGGKPALEADHLGDGVALQGVSWCCENFGQGPGTGVQGISGTGIGVEAISQDGLALAVRGKAGFASAGSAVVPGGQESVFVTNPAVTGESHITVTLADDPGQAQLSWVERRPGSGFAVHLSFPVRRGRDLALTYLIVEPA